MYIYNFIWNTEYVPQRSVEASFTVELGESPSSSAGPYLIRTALADFSRLAKATSSILENFERKVIIVYEDKEYGNAIVPYLNDELQTRGIQLSHKIAIPTYAEDFQILKELEVVMTRTKQGICGARDYNPRLSAVVYC
ncbi:hypothetical protein PTKIN_Ptkin03bG0138700 [Pterospermum kingtungense]